MPRDSQDGKPAASLLLTGGRIRTFDPQNPVAEALLIQGGLIRWVGKAAQAPDSDHRIDVEGRQVVPGLTDAHAHLLLTALSRVQFRTSDQRDLDALLGSIRILAGSAQDWIVSSDYSELSLAEQRHPTRAELDAVAPDRPVLLRRIGGHLSVANSAALAAAGVREDVDDPPGGSFDRLDGQLTGVLRESAEDVVVGAAPPPDPDTVTPALTDLSREYLAYGVVAAVDAAVGFSCGFANEWRVWQSARVSDEFDLRMGFMPNLTLAEAYQHNVARDAEDPNWQLLSLKWFVDGIIGARTAAVSQPYCGLQHCGGFMKPPEVLRDELLAAHEAGWQIAAHTIGDRAINLVLDILEEAARVHPRERTRHRIEHLGVSHPDMMPRLRDLGLAVATQYGFLPKFGSSLRTALPPSLAEGLYPGRSLVGHGVTVAGSSDLPLGPMSPFVGVAAAMHRRCDDGQAINAAECLLYDEALACYAVGGAEVMFHDGFRGRLAKGYRADLAVLDDAPTAEDPDQVAAIRAALTLRDGRIVHSDGSVY